MKNLRLNLPPFAVPSGVAPGDQEIELFASGAYTAKTWTGFTPRAADAATMPVIGAANCVTYAGMDFPEPSLRPLNPAPPLFGVNCPYWGVSHRLVRKPRELILLPETGAFDPVFAPFLTAHAADLLAAKVYINQAASFLGSYGESADISRLKGFIMPSLVYHLPANGYQLVDVEGQNPAGGVQLFSCEVSTNVANAFTGGERLELVSIDMLFSLETNAGYAAWVQSGSGPPTDTYAFRTALGNAHKARCQQTDPYFDKILRVYHLYSADVPVGAEIAALARYKRDFTALCNAVGNCTIVDKGHVPGSNAGVMSVDDIWGYCQSFFGL